MADASIERAQYSFRGVEERGQAISRADILDQLADALLAKRYGKLRQAAKLKAVDRTYANNQAFWPTRYCGNQQVRKQRCGG
jgi:hypothetical protein